MSEWADFLRRLSTELPRPLLATWRMSDGNRLEQEIPAAELLGQDDFLPAAKASYHLYETNELEFAAVSPVDSRPVDLDAIEQAARVSGLIYRRKPDRIIVRSPYRC